MWTINQLGRTPAVIGFRSCQQAAPVALTYTLKPARISTCAVTQHAPPPLSRLRLRLERDARPYARPRRLQLRFDVKLRLVGEAEDEGGDEVAPG